MIAAILTAAALYAATNLDDMILLTVLYAGTAGGKARRSILAGRWLGAVVLTGVSILGACGMRFVPARYIGLLGVVPIMLGIRAWFVGRRNDGKGKALPDTVSAVSVALITISGGADNLGVYIPAFTGCTGGQMAITVIVFAVMTVLWCAAAAWLAGLPVVGEKIEQYKRIIVPVVFVALGVMILAEAYLF